MLQKFKVKSGRVMPAHTMDCQFTGNLRKQMDLKRQRHKMLSRG